MRERDDDNQWVSRSVPMAMRQAKLGRRNSIAISLAPLDLKNELLNRDECIGFCHRGEAFMQAKLDWS